MYISRAAAAARHLASTDAIPASLVVRPDLPGSAFWFNPDSLHAFRPLPRLLTFEYKDYALSNERAQNDAWKTAREAARQEAAAAIDAERTAISKEERDVRIMLECGPLPLAGFVQERCLSHMPTQRADLTYDARGSARGRPSHAQSERKVHAKPQPRERAYETRAANPNLGSRKRPAAGAHKS